MDKNHLYGAWHQARELDLGLRDSIKHLSKFVEPNDPTLNLLKLYKTCTEKILNHLEKGGVTEFCEKEDTQ